MNRDNRKLLNDYYKELWNNWRFELAKEILAEDLIFRGSLGTTQKGIEGFVEYAKMMQQAFPDLYHAVEDVVFEGEKAAARLVYSGIHKGKLFDYEPTGFRVRYVGASFFTFREGRIAQIWVLGDLYGLYNELEGNR